MRPPNNHVLVAVPERFVTSAVPGQKRLLLPAGSDDWASMTEELKAGTATRIESDEPIPLVPVRQGQVLATPDQLTADMGLFASSMSTTIARFKVVHDAQGKAIKQGNGRAQMVSDGYTDAPLMRTCADITERVEVGDTIRFDHTYLTDENEVSPGVYSLPYVAIICVVVDFNTIDPADTFWDCLTPIGGYVLLKRVWADDVRDELIDGNWCKTRYTAGGLLAQVNVPPLPHEGEVAWVGAPLRRTTDTLAVRQRVVFNGYHQRSDKSRPLDSGQAFTDTIAGTSYLCIRQDYILAIRTSHEKQE